MAVRKLSISLPAELVAEARCEVGDGGLSALLAAALQKELRARRLQKLLDELDEEFGPVGKEATAWADRVWREAHGG